MDQDTFKTKKTLKVGENEYQYYDLHVLEEVGVGKVSTLPFTHKILLENLLRHENGRSVTADDIRSFVNRTANGRTEKEISFSPARVLMQDFTGVPVVVDLAAMREAMEALGGNAEKINPIIPVDLVIDHSVMVDSYHQGDSLDKNVSLEYDRNRERYAFLRWGQKAFKNFRVVPPGTGICHQVNLEYLAQVVWTSPNEQGEKVAYPDTLVGTDSHTTMVNGLAVLGWGVGGIEAEAAMLAQPLSMLIPDVVGFKLTGRLTEGITATDLVLTITNILRTKGVVGKFVEFYGDGLSSLSLADRATIANMAPEYGATCGFFPIDEETIKYLEFTGRDHDRIELVEAYAKNQGLWYNQDMPDPLYDETIELPLESVLPTIAGPKRPQDKVLLQDAAVSCLKTLEEENKNLQDVYKVEGRSTQGEVESLRHGDVVIAAITSCTNTSNPSVLISAGLLAQKAHALGLKVKPWVKTSLAPGSQVVTDYLTESGLMESLESLGFYLVGYGCTTCIGNSGPLDQAIGDTIDKNDISVSAVLSGNRNFEGRIHPQVKLNYLASPPLVVAYALAGTMKLDLTKDPLGEALDGTPVYLKDIWPSTDEIHQVMEQFLTPEMFRNRYKNVFTGDAHWKDIGVTQSITFDWDKKSTYVQNPPYFEEMSMSKKPLNDIKKGRILALLGDSVTTDHISPAGTIKKESPAGSYLMSHCVDANDFNSYGSRRGNHEVMIRGTFANIRLNNEMVPEKTGGFTRLAPKGDIVSIYEASEVYQETKTPLIIVAGREYGTGSSRDWAAKGAALLGIKAVIAESFERIHRSNLVGMGVLPLQFPQGVTRQTLGLTGFEAVNILGLEGKETLTAGSAISVEFVRESGEKVTVPTLCRIDTQDEVDYFLNGGILPYVLQQIARNAVAL